MLKQLMTAPSLRRSAATVALRLANGDIMEGDLTGQKSAWPLSATSSCCALYFRHRHQIKPLFYKTERPGWEMLLGSNCWTLPIPVLCQAGAPCSLRRRTS